MRALITTLAARSDMPLSVVQMLREQALRTLDSDGKIQSAERPSVRADIEAFFADVARSVTTAPTRDSN